MKIKLILAFFLFYLVALAVTLPASTAFGFIPKNAGIKASEVSGSLWNGSALLLTYKKQIQLQKLSWKFDWSALSRLKLKIAIKFDNDIQGISGDGFILLGLSGVSVEDLSIAGNAMNLISSGHLAIPVEAKGDVSLVIKKASQGSPYCQELDGYAIWDNAKINAEIGSIDLDSAHIDLSCDEGKIAAKLKQSSDQLTTTADFLLEEKGIYQLQGLLKAGDTLDPSIKDGLSWIGDKNKAGDTIFQFTGKL